MLAPVEDVLLAEGSVSISAGLRTEGLRRGYRCSGLIIVVVVSWKGGGDGMGWDGMG